jgi:hypothetical protein
VTAENSNELVADLARIQVAAIAPDELPLFRVTSETFFKDPQKALVTTKKGEDMLGFGAAEALAFVTPVILAMATDVVQYLATELGKTIKAEGSGFIQEAIRGLFSQARRHDATSGPLPPVAGAALSPEQLREVRRIALQRALDLKVPEGQATLLADSLVGGLVAAA